MGGECAGIKSIVIARHFMATKSDGGPPRNTIPHAQTHTRTHTHGISYRSFYTSVQGYIMAVRILFYSRSPANGRGPARPGQKGSQ